MSTSGQNLRAATGGTVDATTDTDHVDHWDGRTLTRTTPSTSSCPSWTTSASSARHGRLPPPTTRAGSGRLAGHDAAASRCQACCTTPDTASRRQDRRCGPSRRPGGRTAHDTGKRGDRGRRDQIRRRVTPGKNGRRRRGAGLSPTRHCLSRSGPSSEPATGAATASRPSPRDRAGGHRPQGVAPAPARATNRHPTPATLTGKLSQSSYEDTRTAAQCDRSARGKQLLNHKIEQHLCRRQRADRRARASL
jgi:hypothetical protein